MIGQARRASIDRNDGKLAEALLPVALTPDAKYGARYQFVANVARPYSVTEGARGLLASVDTFGRGLLSSSGKTSERNTRNMALVFTSNQYATQKSSPQAWRNFSYPMPLPKAGK